MNASGSTTKIVSIGVFHQWIINSYSVHSSLMNTGDCLTSKEFGSLDGKHKFELKLYPNGKLAEFEDHLSLYLIYKSESFGRINMKLKLSLQTTKGQIECPLNKPIVQISTGSVITASKFFSHAEIKSKRGIILAGDILTINVDLQILKTALNNTNYGLEYYLNKIDAPKLVSVCGKDKIVPLFKDQRFECVNSVCELLTSGKLYDFKIVTSEGETIGVHKAILSNRCPYFDALFSHSDLKEVTEGMVKFDDITKETMLSVLKYIYYGRLEKMEKNTKVYVVADRFQLNDLQNIIEQHLIEDVNEQNVCDLICFGEQYGAFKLKNRCIHFISKKVQTILESEDWKSLEHKEPALAAQILRKILLFNEKRNDGETSHLKRPQIDVIVPPSKRRRPHF
uniref:BTB domain-containing protein n=1 Tax=Rhabditophanes sp. KR3021 TaxID=114890 RepID=A0AC35TJN7_9BILA